MSKKDRKLHHISTSSMQRIPVISASIACLLALSLLILDIFPGQKYAEYLKIIYEIMVVTSGFFIVFCLSVILGFCKTQIFGILYTYCFIVCMWAVRYSDWVSSLLGHHIITVHLILFLVGMFYVIHVLRRKTTLCR